MAYQRACDYFRHFDANGDGVIDKDEFVALHADLQRNQVTDKSYGDAMAEIDADGVCFFKNYFLFFVFSLSFYFLNRMEN